MAKSELAPSEALYPVPVVLVSCSDKITKKANIITIAWCGIVCSNPPLLSISIRPSRHSHGLISDAGDFVVNIPSADMIKEVDMCGITSGKDTDKARSCSFTLIPSKKISAPAISECPVNIECILKNVTKLGSHDIFIAEIVSVSADKDICVNGKIDYKKAAPFVYNQGEYWDLGKKIGHYGFSR